MTTFAASAALAVAICVAHAQRRYGVPSALVNAVLVVEGGGPNVVHRNHDGSEDLGWMQINSRWLPWLSRYGINRSSLLGNPCVNIGVGAWILRRCYLRYDNWTDAIAAYNAGTHLTAGRVYARRVIQRWRSERGVD